ncbi:uncharacterized protein LOC114750204 [Neltuma alba]|uniref:uncharacterized protein LOC114750204 n=1 Tax=Neltuma alba TaxID=207710 RepID=UPI0010A4BEBD|nr:uncharacterized protein LOC114750204 [Prosopis alba]
MKMVMMRNLARKVAGVSSWNVKGSGSRGWVVGVRHVQVGGESGEAAGGAITTMEEVGKASSEVQQEKAYSSSSSSSSSRELDAADHNKPRPSPRFVKQNAERVKASMNTKNTN